MENACALCYDLVLHHKSHTELRKISELKGSELYKCCCCHAYLHKHNSEWEIISSGSITVNPQKKHPINISSTEMEHSDQTSHQH